MKKYLLLGGVLLLLLARPDVAVLEEAWRGIRSISLSEALSLVLLNVCVILVLAARGFVILRGLGSDTPFVRWLQARQLGFLISITTPGPQFGGEPAQVLALQECGLSSARAIAVTAADKVVDVILNTVVTLALAFVVVLLGLIDLGLAAESVGAWIVTIGLFVGAAGFLIVGLRRGLLNRWELGKRLQSDIELLAGLPGSVWSGALGLGIGAVALMAAEWWLLWSMISSSAGFGLIVSTWVAARVSLWGPVPGAVGVFEGAVLGATLAVGGSWSEAAAVCGVARARDLGLIVSSAALSFREWLSWRG